MLLKSLELQGFKTFPDKTLLKFEEGITAVVGPNGSGKSNISDAMRWVLGEQSTRALRCSKMEDIIFSGTPQRRAQGFAEVTITIDNADRRLNFDGEGRPMLQVFNTCKHFIRTIPNLVYDESNVEDIDTRQEDHIYDECRYVLMENPISPPRHTSAPPVLDDPLELHRKAKFLRV